MNLFPILLKNCTFQTLEYEDGATFEQFYTYNTYYIYYILEGQIILKHYCNNNSYYISAWPYIYFRIFLWFTRKIIISFKVAEIWWISGLYFSTFGPYLGGFGDLGGMLTQAIWEQGDYVKFFSRSGQIFPLQKKFLLCFLT